MIATLREAASAAAGAAIGFGLSAIYWLGLPILNDRPAFTLPLAGEVHLSALPVIGPLVVGHLQVAIDKAVADARANMVSTVELAAAKAEAEVMARQRAAAEQLNEEYRRKAAAAAAAAAMEDAQREQERRDYETTILTAGAGCVLDPGAVEWLQRHDRPPR